MVVFTSLSEQLLDRANIVVVIKRVCELFSGSLTAPKLEHHPRAALIPNLLHLILNLLGGCHPIQRPHGISAFDWSIRPTISFPRPREYFTKVDPCGVSRVNV